MHDVVRVIIKLEQLITDLPGFLSDLNCVIKNRLPGSIICDFMNNEDVMHTSLDKHLPSNQVIVSPSDKLQTIQQLPYGVR